MAAWNRSTSMNAMHRVQKLYYCRRETKNSTPTHFLPQTPSHLDSLLPYIRVQFFRGSVSTTVNMHRHFPHGLTSEPTQTQVFNFSIKFSSNHVGEKGPFIAPGDVSHKRFRTLSRNLQFYFLQVKPRYPFLTLFLLSLYLLFSRRVSSQNLMFPLPSRMILRPLPTPRSHQPFPTPTLPFPLCPSKNVKPSP